MSERLSSKHVVTRKEHECWGCGILYPKKTEMHVINAVDDDKQFMTTYWCKVCQEYWDKNMSYGDEIDCGDLKFNDPEGWEKIILAFHKI